MNPFDIYRAARTWNDCDDARPWLIIDVRQGVFGCFPFSTKQYSGHCIEIDANHQDFPATGLATSCLLYDDRIIEVRRDQMRARKGALQRELLAYVRGETGL